MSLAAGLVTKARGWWRRQVIDDDPMDDERWYWQHLNHCTDMTCPCQGGRRDAS